MYLPKLSMRIDLALPAGYYGGDRVGIEAALFLSRRLKACP